MHYRRAVGFHAALLLVIATSFGLCSAVDGLSAVLPLALRAPLLYAGIYICIHMYMEHRCSMYTAALRRHIYIHAHMHTHVHGAPLLYAGIYIYIHACIHMYTERRYST